MIALVLCAGRGERLKPLTDTIPKPLIDVNGKAILDYVLDRLKYYKYTDIIVNTNYLYEQIVAHVGKRALVSYEPTPLGTAGAIRKIANWINEDFLVVNGDTINFVNYADMEYAHYVGEKAATVFTHDTATHNGGAFYFKKQVVDFIPEDTPFSIHEDLLPLLGDDVLLYRSDVRYYDCGTLEKLERARREVL